jgi:glycosyltransferase involved in cell wall biosynthesis
VRVVHAHSDSPELVYRRAWWAALIRPTARRLMERFATHGIAVSEPAAVAKFGPDWKKDGRWRLLRCGIELESLKSDVDRRNWRRRYGIPEQAIVLAHVGRFGPEKNHPLLLDAAAELKKRGALVRVILMGDGGSRERIADRAHKLKLSREVMFLGYRSDVSSWLRGAADVMMFPSFFEGLPLAVVEAQAAGVPVVMSDRITREAVVVPDLVRTLAVDAPAARWADEVLRLASGQRPAGAWNAVAESPFNIEASADALERFYREALSFRQ